MKTERTEFGSEVSDGDRIAFDHEGFRVRAVVKRDDSPDLSYLGEFSDSPEDGAIEHHATGKWLGRSYRGPRYFNPANPEDPDVAHGDYERCRAYHIGEWDVIGIVLTVSRNGVDLGLVSLWGIESDSGADYFKEVVGDLLSEALAEARNKLADLVKFAQEH